MSGSPGVEGSGDELRLRPLTGADLPLMHRWLNDPAVVRWWEGDDVSWDGVVAEYHPDAHPDVEHWLGILGGQPVGWIQCYPIAAFPDEDEPRAWRSLGVPETAAGIDYLIGDAGDRGRGVGRALIARFVDEVVFGQHPDWDPVAASPQVANVASWRALAGAGFVPRGDIDDPVGPCRLMVRHRTSAG